MSTSDSVRVGIKWIGVSLAVTQAVRFLTTAVLARLLTPEIFGLVAMAHVAITLIGVIREVGVGAAFIQRQDRDPEDAANAANTTFLLSLVVNGVLFLLAWFAAPLVVRFFEADGLQAVLRAMFAVFLIDAFDTTPTMILQKRLQFERHAAGSILACAVNAGVAIGMAFAGFGVWSLVAGQLSSRAARAVLVFALARFRPRLTFDRAIAGELFAYGRYLWAFAVLSAVGGSLDRLILGRWLGAATLGIYDMALNLSNLPASHISGLVNQLTFPSFARIQGDPAALRRALHKTIRHVSLLSVPLAFGMLAVANDLILTVYGEKWADAVPVIQVLAFYGLSLSIASITGPVLKAIGRPQILLYSSIVHHSVLLALLFALGGYGPVGIAYAVLTPMLISAGLAYALIFYYLSFPLRDIFVPLFRTGAPALAMYAAVRAFHAQLDPALAHPASLLACVAVGGVTYLVLSVLVNRAGLVEVTTTLREALLSKGKFA